MSQQAHLYITQLYTLQMRPLSECEYSINPSVIQTMNVHRPLLLVYGVDDPGNWEAIVVAGIRSDMAYTHRIYLLL